MSALPAISEISKQGITARVEGDELVVSAPKGTLTPEVLAELKSKKPELLRSLRELQERAGSDWDEVSADPAKLRSFAELVMITDMRHRGIVPEDYTANTECKHCGPVPIWEGCPPQVNGCPWCFNRIKDISSQSCSALCCNSCSERKSSGFLLFSLASTSGVSVPFGAETTSSSPSALAVIPCFENSEIAGNALINGPFRRGPLRPEMVRHWTPCERKRAKNRSRTMHRSWF